MRARKRERAWLDFAAWCVQRNLRPLPAHPWTLAAYARWCETRYRYPMIVGRIQAIARVHLLACAAAPDRHPTVTRTLRSLELRSGARTSRAALFPADATAKAAPEAPASGAAAEPRPRRRRSGTGLRTSPRLVPRRPKKRG